MRRALTPLLVAGAVLFPVAPATAGPSSEVNGGTLRITGTDGIDVIGIRCDGGNVMVFDQNPGTGDAACSAIDAIVVEGKGGNDGIYLQEVLPVDFPSLIEIRVDGGGGNDTFHGSAFDDEIAGGDGNDEVYASPGADDLSGSFGDDRLLVHAVGNVKVTDTSLVTPEGTATLSGFEDLHLTSESRQGVRFDARGFRGNTLMQTGQGDDRLLGAVGRDFLTGGGGHDRLVGKDGWDHLFGGDGRDTLLGGPGNDRLYGGAGRDTCRGGSGGNLVIC